jgi:hypothetical protein
MSLKPCRSPPISRVKITRFALIGQLGSGIEPRVMSLYRLVCLENKPAKVVDSGSHSVAMEEIKGVRP